MIIIDLETTGIDPNTHYLVSIGALDYHNPQNQFYGECHIPQTAPIDPRALEVNGFTIQELFDTTKPSQKELIEQFEAWREQAKQNGNHSINLLAGNNVRFDRDLYLNNAKRLGIEIKADYKTIDLHTICFSHLMQREETPPTKYDGSGISTNFSLQYSGLPPEPNPHNGLTGAKMEAEAIHRIWTGTFLLEEFKTHPIPEYLQK